LALAFSGAAAASALVFLADLPTGALTAAIVAMMAAFGLMPGFVFANVPGAAATPERAALAYGAIALFGNVGTFSGTPLFAASYQAGGWPAVFGVIAALCVIGVLLAASVRPRHP
jgi:predicted MFS family arabinose efflux permease